MYILSLPAITDMKGLFENAAKKHIQGVSPEELFVEGNIFTSFMSIIAGSDKMYMPIPDMDKLKKSLEEKLAEYNETFAAMELVLFKIAMEHICRICRIIDLPCGNALLVGVGGSGKQSLAMLSSFIMTVDVVRILVTQTYGVPDLLLDLQTFYIKAAVKPGTPHAFLMTDGQIADERFLVYLNDMLSSGNIPNLFTREEMDGHLGAIRNLAKAAGVPDDRGALSQFFFDRVRLNLQKKLQSQCDINIDRLEKGLTIMELVQARVQGLKDDLAVKMIQVAEKKASTDVLIENVTQASEKAAAEEAAANIEV